MIVLGWVLTIIGILIGLGGMILYENTVFSYAIYATYGSSEAIQSVMVLGVVLIIAGIICMVCGFSSKSNAIIKSPLNTRKCLKCGHICNIKTIFCDKCGNNIATQGKKLDF